MITVEVQSALMNEAIAKMAKSAGVAFSKVLRGEGRLLAQDIVKLSYPRTQKQGREAVAKGISSAIASAARLQKTPGMRKLIETKDYSEANRRFAGKWIFSPDIRRIHNAKRVNGRVARNKNKTFTLDVAGHAKYVREIQKRVGMTKGSIAHDLGKLGGTAPAWVKNKGRNLGMIRVSPTLIEIQSNARGFSNVKRQVGEALKKRTNALRKKANLAMANESKRLGIIRSYS